MDRSGNNLKAMSGHYEDILQNGIAPILPKDDDGHAFVPPKPVENVVHKQEKYNLNKCDFDLLVTKVGKKDFVQNMKNIFQFLTSNIDEHEFRDISKDMEEILVRIVKDVDVLKSNNIYGKSYCEKIIEILSHTTDSRIYKLVCFFKKESQEMLLQGLGAKCKNILVYKKVYGSLIPAIYPSLSSMSSSPQISPTASTNSLNITPSLIKTPPSKDHFIPHCFQLIINFVKDTTQQSLEFTGLSDEDAKFLHSSFSSIIAGDARGKNVCVELWETVKVYLSRFEFKIMYETAQSLDTKSLRLEKQSRMNASSSTDAPSDTSSKLIKIKTSGRRRLSKYGKMLNNLNYDFVTRSLERLVNFLSDDAQGSLPGGHTNEPETKFLKNITTMARTNKVQAACDEKHWRLFLEMRKLLDGANFKIRTKVNDRKGGVGKEVLYIKEPRFENSKQQRETSWSRASNINFQAGGLMAEMTCEGDLLLTEAIQKQDMPKNILETLKPKEPKPNQTQPERGRILKGKGSNLEVKPRNKDQQLIDALSVPVKSDKALKMMMGMGWTGGALGPRGDGITEPIMPHLRNDTAAGLGHKKEVKVFSKQIQRETCVESVLQIEKIVRQPDPPMRQPDSPRRQPDPRMRQPAEFRKIFLRSVLDLLNSNDLNMTLDFKPSLHKKERSFARHAISTFASRTKFPLADNGEQTIADEVAKHYANDLELMVTACVSDDGRQIFLKKKHGVVLTQKVEIENIDFTIHKDPKRAMYHLLDKFGPIVETQTSMESAQFKVETLLQLLNLVKDENEKQINIIIKKKLTKRQKNYLKLCIDGINKRASFGSTKVELALSIEIIKNVKVGVYALRIEFGEGMKSYTVTKDYEATFSQTADLDSSGDEIDYSLSDNDNDMTDKSEDKIIKQISNINDASEGNNHKLEVKIENSSEVNNNDNLEPQAVNESDLNISELAKAIDEENIDEIKTGENIPESDISIVDDVIVYSSDDMSMSENSGFTDNLDYNETDEIYINMSDDGTNSDKKINKTLDLSNISSSTLNVENGSKIIDLSFIIVYLTKQCDVCKDMPKYIQGIISHNIMEIKEKKDLPFLKCHGEGSCHGLRDNFLIYSCHTKKSYDWLQNICVAYKITICTKEFDKMSLKIKKYFEFDEKYIFDLLEMYNEKISTKEWSILKNESLGDSLIVDVKMDKNSVKSVLESNCELYAGVDKVTFCIIWE